MSPRLKKLLGMGFQTFGFVFYVQAMFTAIHLKMGITNGTTVVAGIGAGVVMIFLYRLDHP